MFRFWRNMDDDDKSRLVRIIGLVVALAAVFTLLSTVSYFFTWKADQSSLTSAVGDTTVEVSNAGGKLGYRWADLLVRKWFGLGSLAFIVILFAVSVRLLLRRWRYSMLKTTLLTFSGALVASFALAFVSDLTGLGNAFGGGLGGECGESVIRWSSVVFGTFLTGFLLVFLVVLWLVFASRRFSCWLMSLGKKDPDEPAVPQDQEPETPVSGQAGAAAGRGTSNLSVSTPSLRQAQEPEPVPGPSSPQAQGQDETAKEPGKDSGESLEVIKGKELTTKVTSDLPRINVRDELPDYKFPSLELLDTYSSGRSEVTDEELSRNNARIRTALENYRIQINDVKAIVGPTVTLYKV